MKKIPYNKQYIDQDDIDAVVEALNSDFLTTGPQSEKFENKLKNLKQDILKDLLKENPKDLLKKFDKLFK